VTTTRDVTDVVLGFARTLRHAGVDASPERVQAMLVAVGPHAGRRTRGTG
jgi:hypothetical protein